MFPANIQLTSAYFWQVTLVVASLDILLILLIWRFIPTSRYRRLSPWITVCSFLFFAALWSFVLAWGWDWFYRYIFQPWMRYSGLAWGVGYGMLGFGMWWLSIRLGRLLSGSPAVNFCLLGGLEGWLSHLWAIFGLGVVSRPPILHGVDPLAVLIFAVFEKAFYWILILLLAVGISHVSERVRHQPQPV